MESWHLQTSSELANARRWAVPKVPWVSRRPPTSLPPSSFLWPEVPTSYVPILSSVARISNQLTGLMQTFTFLTSQDSGPGQSWAVRLGPEPGPPLLSDPQPHNQVGQNYYFKTFQLLCYSGYDHHQYESLSSPPQDAVWQAWKRAQVLTTYT